MEIDFAKERLSTLDFQGNLGQVQQALVILS